jgi:uncharacterized protein (TIGR02246 family)
MISAPGREDAKKNYGLEILREIPPATGGRRQVASPREVYEQLRAACAAADAGAASALYAENGVFTDADNAVHTGRDDVADYYKGYFATRGPVQYTVKRQVEGGDGTVLTEWTAASTEAGRHSTGLPGATVIEVGRGGITYHRDYR